MRQLLVSVIALLASMGLMLLGSGLMGTLLSIRMSLDGVSPLIKGLVLSAFYLGLLVGSQQAGRVIRRVGHIRAFAIFSAVCGASILLHGLYVIPAVWFVLRVAIGFSTAGLYLVVESWLHERSGAMVRGRLFSLYQTVSYAGLGLGQFLLLLGDPAGPSLFMVIAVLFALCLVPVALSRASDPPEPGRHVPMAVGATIRQSPLAAWTCVASGIVSSVVFTLTPAYALSLGLDVGSVTWVMAALILGGGLLQWPIGHLSDQCGRRLMILMVGVMSAATAILIASYGTRMPFVALLGVMAVYGGFAFTYYPLAVSHANDSLASGSDFVTVAGALLFLWGLGASSGPIVLGWLVGEFGQSSLFIVLAGIGLITSVVSVCCRSASQPRFAYRAMCNTTILVDLDPRTEDDTR